MTQQNYVSRDDLLRRIKKARKALERGKSPRKVARYLKAVETEAAVSWVAANRTDEHRAQLKQIKLIVMEEPGITYRQIAEKMGKSINHVKNMVKLDSQAFYIEERKDLKGAFGKKPYGLTLWEGDDLWRAT